MQACTQPVDGSRERGFGETMIVQPGETAPDFTLKSVEGPPIALGEILSGGRNALLVFLRHLG
ncbi:MAG TPA: hypothetical protein DEP84_00165 [Chloroflexi bacterium]|nr:hypothetical protein [Chloroflexota bacterium]